MTKMHRTGCLVCALALAALAVSGQDGKSNSGAEAFHRVITGVRAVAHEGGGMRGAQWTGKVTPGKRVLVPLFLFEKNDYFIVIAPDQGVPDPELECGVYDVIGVPLLSTEVRGQDRIVLTFRPRVSGRAYVSLLLPEGAKPVELAVGYAFR